MRLRGDYYDPGSSRRTAAELDAGRDGTLTVFVDGRRLSSARLAEVRVSDRIGETPRTVHLPDGAAFETVENDALDAALALHGVGGTGRALHLLESRWTIALGFVLVVLLAAYWTVAIGIPRLARRVAFSLPPSMHRSLGRHSLDVLDRSVFAPSALDAARRNQMETRFTAMARDLEATDDVRLVFRRSRLGPNAFALPSGDVILTDELVKLAHDDDEMVAVLAHEMGHVVHRHGLRHALQNSTIALLAVAVTADAATVSSFAAGLPTLLVEARYSREFEREADRYALAYLQRHGIDPAHFAHLLARIDAEPGGLTFLSTHPSTDERTALFTPR